MVIVELVLSLDTTRTLVVPHVIIFVQVLCNTGVSGEKISHKYIV